MVDGHHLENQKLAISLQWSNFNRIWHYIVFRKKQYTWFLVITSVNIDRFSKFFHSQIVKDSLNIHR